MSGELRLQLSPSVQVRWDEGEIELTSGSSPRCHRWRGGELLAMLDRFAEPALLDEVVAACAEYEPAELRALLDELRASGVLVPAEVAATQTAVARDLERVGQDEALAWLSDALQRPGLVVEDQGQTVSTCGRAALSPGCQACKDGGWVCAYLGFRCNARCSFCPQPSTRALRDEDRLGDAFLGSLLAFVDRHATRVTGLSLSGGESLLYLDGLRRLLAHRRAQHPDLWIWAYTNGIALSDELLEELAALGLSELRVNLAATDWSPAVRARVERAVALLPWVTVEVPSTARTHARLLEDDLLGWLEDVGVRQLNLAQLCIPLGPDPGPVGAHHAQDGPFVEQGGALWSLPSRARSLDVLAEAAARGLALRVNDCSGDARVLQERARRLRWGRHNGDLRRHCWPHPARFPGPLAPPADAERSPTGLAWQTLAAGAGSRPGPQDWVRVHSTGWDADGRVIDSTWLRADQGQLLPLADAIPGWAEGVGGMRVGERRLLWVPAPLAYGDGAAGPAGALRFDVELLDVAG